MIESDRPAVSPVLLIGGAGFIGLAVCRLLAASGREVVILGRGAPPAEPLPTGCRYVQGDYANVGVLRGVLPPGGDVVNLAYSTVPKTSFSDPTFDLLSNLPASVTLLQEVGRIGVNRLLIVSSGGTVYGEPTNLPIHEDHPTLPISPYGITKLTIDSYARMFHITSGLPVLIVRPANAYGEEQRTGVGQGFIATAIEAIQAGRPVEIYGKEGTVRDYIHVHDVASGIVAALERGGIGEVYNLGSGSGASNLDILRLLGRLAEADGFVVQRRHLPERRFDVSANVLDSSRLSQATGWAPTIPLTEGLTRLWHEALRRRVSKGDAP
jgi:UDP-glucose 4-epimerase